MQLFVFAVSMYVVVDPCQPKPNQRFLPSLDGFGAHLDPETLEVFAKYKILIVKEEGDTSQMCQAYDQNVAKTDKRFTREMLDRFKFNVSNNVDQWELILVANAAFNETAKTNSWRTSFIKVNMCPSKAISPNEWIGTQATRVVCQGC